MKDNGESVRIERDGNGYPDCRRCMGNGVVAMTTLGRPYPDARTEPCPECGGNGRGPFDFLITEDVRLGALITGLGLASLIIRNAVKQASPPTVLRQPMDRNEHRGHWLTRAQVYDAVQAASEIERIVREVQKRVSDIGGGTDA